MLFICKLLSILYILKCINSRFLHLNLQYKDTLINVTDVSLNEFKPTPYNNTLYEGPGAANTYHIFVRSHTHRVGVSGSIVFNDVVYTIDKSLFWTYLIGRNAADAAIFEENGVTYYGYVNESATEIILKLTFTLPPLIKYYSVDCRIKAQTMSLIDCTSVDPSLAHIQFTYIFDLRNHSDNVSVDVDALTLYCPELDSAFVYGTFYISNGTDNFYEVSTLVFVCNPNCIVCENLAPERIAQKHCGMCKLDFYFYEEEKKLCKSLDEFPANSYILVKENYDVIKPCDTSCATCSETVTNCTQCANGFAFVSHYIDNPTSCYPVTQLYTDSYEYDSITNTFICKYNKFIFNEGTNQYECVSVCPKGKEYIILSMNECVSSCFEYDLYVYITSCVETCPKGSTLNTETLICESGYNDMITNIPIEDAIINVENIITDYTSSLQNESITIQGNDYTLQIVNTTTTQIRNDISTISLGKCEDILRKHYNISLNETLLIVKVDITQDDSVTNKVEYAVYDLKGNQLDLSLCMSNDITIEIVYPLNPEYFDDIDIEFAEEMMNDKGIDLYNMNDTFFNDICMTYATNNKTDVVIRDRRNDYFVNISLCEKNCLYQGVNYTTKQVTCLCKVDKDIDYDNEIEYEPSFTKEFFTVIKSSFNFDFLKCYAHLYTFSNLKSNIGFWIMGCIIIINTVCVITFFNIDLPNFYIKLFFHDKQDKTSLNTNINVNSNNNNKHNVSEIKEEENENEDSNNDNKSVNSDKNSEMHLQKHNNCTSSTSLQANTKTIHMNDDTIPSLHIINGSSNNINNSNNTPFPNPPSRSTFTSSLFNEKLKHNPSSSPSNKHIQYLRRSSTFHTQVIKIQNEINSLPFKLAVNDDKRKCLGMFFNILGRKFDLINIIIFRCEFDSISLCISSFLLSFTLDLFFGAMLFNDDIISKRYVNGGSLGFLTDSFISLLTKVFTIIMNFIIKKLTVYEGAIELLKSKYIYDDKYELKCYQCMKVCKKKLICFYLFNFILLSGTWYYLALFCSVYKQSQMNWFEDCLLGNAFQIVVVVVLVLIVALLRYLAIKYKSKKMYNASLYLNQKC